MNDFPELLKKWLREDRYDLLAVTFRLMAERKASYYLHTQAAAIRAVKAEFEHLSGVKPYGNMITHPRWDLEIARYCHTLGAKRLIDDMRLVYRAGVRPRSVVYFIHRTDGNACRWDQLMTAEAERRAEIDRKELNEMWNARALIEKIREKSSGKIG